MTRLKQRRRRAQAPVAAPLVVTTPATGAYAAEGGAVR
jgi:hypothetical protein